jgi:hypothetical protein
VWGRGGQEEQSPTVPSEARITIAVLPPEVLTAAWVPNRGGACTTASVLAALGALGARALPELLDATLQLGAQEPLGAPALLDYVSLPGRPAPLDRRVEDLAARHGVRVSCHSRLVVPLVALHVREPELLVANLAWGQERPGHYGSWGWRPLEPATYSTGGHSVLVVATGPEGWLVLDSNHEGLQRWPRPGVAVTTTRISPVA